MSNKIIDMNPIKGLELLLAPGRGNSWMHLDNCHEYITRLSVHPFGLELYTRPFGSEPSSTEPIFGQREIIVVGAGCATDTIVNAFLANIRYWVGAPEETQPTALRVISTPFSRKPDGRHYVFFEIQIGGTLNIISGETTDCSGAGNAGRQELEKVFSLLSLLYGIEIKRVDITEQINLQELCAQQCV